jgi:polysaccharide biosynthesis transport protein
MKPEVVPEASMDGIMPLRGNPPGSLRPSRPVTATADPYFSTNPAAIKTPAHYFRAVRRRIWLIMAVAVPLAIATSILALRQPRIYQARAEITIEPPELNPVLQTLISNEMGRHDPTSQEKYVPNRIALLQSKSLADAVVADPTIAPELVSFDDPAQELIISALQVRPVGKTNWFIVLLEGQKPARTKKLLEILLEKFKKLSEEENWDRMMDTKGFAADRLREMKDELEKIDKKIYDTLKTVRTIGPGGKNIFEEQYINLENTLAHKQMRLGELNQQLLIAKSFPRADFSSGGSSREQQIALLEAEKRKWIRVLMKAKRIEHPKQFDHDPAVREYAQRLDEVLNELDELKSIKTQMAENPTEMILDQYRREIEDDKAQHQTVLAQMQDSMPEHQQFLSMVEDRKQTQLKIADMQRKIDSFEILKKSQKEPVIIPASVVEPIVPVRPSRTLYIGMGLMLSLGFGIGLVVLLEHVDHSVKVPEHVTHGLTLPLLGVVPRIRRTVLTHRAGHLWTPGIPDSLEADAFRNIRASLLGVTDRRGPMVTLLVTSPKAGDGKSTAALNLAATCARAGERTLLVDVDLRRPTLGDVFPPEPDKEETMNGLVEVLQGMLPWQKTLRHTELRNLDFIATGNPHDIPIEILGTLELRQLLTALANHYDRVILDGPAVLGMADCRMLGRIVDASLLVIRAGAHQLVTLQRAKAMLEQSHVLIAGVIVNSLREDLQNWSSYGYDGASTALLGKALRARADNEVLNQEHRRGETFHLAGSVNT